MRRRRDLSETWHMTEVLDRPDVSAAEVVAAGGDGGVATPKIGRFDYKWIALGVVLLGTIMTILDATIVNIAIPTLQVDLKAGSYADISWVVTGYMLAQGAVIPMAGWRAIASAPSACISSPSRYSRSHRWRAASRRTSRSWSSSACSRG